MCNQWGERRHSWGETHDAPIERQITRLRLDDTTIERVVRAIGSEQDVERPVALDVARVQRRKRQLALDHAAGSLTDDEYLKLAHAIPEEAPPAPREAKVTATQAVAYLRDLDSLWEAATDQERADLLHAIYTRITVTRDGFVGAELTPDAYAHGLALSMRESFALASTLLYLAGNSVSINSTRGT